MICEACQREMVPYHQTQRFCSRQCSDIWFQQERREAVEWYRSMGLRPELRREEEGKS
jgi:hypothetical protein